MNRRERRHAARMGRRRTKPPIPRMKTRLPGEHTSEARAVLIEQATSAGRYSASMVRPALLDLLRLS